LSKKAQLRIHQLAKEIGVASKDIVAKCQAEEIPDITNHMSPVTVGLAQTIREWFGSAEGGVATAVETAEKVDLDALAPPPKPARKRAAKKKATSAKATEVEGEGDEKPAKKTTRKSTVEVAAEADESTSPTASTSPQALRRPNRRRRLPRLPPRPSQRPHPG
jgi:hypothetical protein